MYLPIAEVSVNILILFGMGGMVGILSGMFGVGGGFLMTPLLIFYGIPPIVAVATEANQIVASSISGAYAHWRRAAVDIKMGTILLIGGVIGSLFGIRLFVLLKNLGQIDLIISLSYVILLGIIGTLTFVEGIRSMIIPNELRTLKKRNRERLWIFVSCWTLCSLKVPGVPQLKIICPQLISSIDNTNSPTLPDRINSFNPVPEA